MLRENRKGKGLVGQPVVTKTTLPDGTNVDGLQDLKSYLVNKRREQFAKAFTTKLLTFALGRSLELTDEDTVEQLTAEFVASDFRIEQLIQRVVASEPFQTK